MEFTSADIFQHSPLGDILNSLRSLSLSGESWPNYVRQDWDADDEEIRRPPTTHIVVDMGHGYPHEGRPRPIMGGGPLGRLKQFE